MTAQPYAIVLSGTVVNTCPWDGTSPWTPPVGSTVVNISGMSPQPSVGWTYSGGIFSPPAPPAPVPPTPQQISEIIAASNQAMVLSKIISYNRNGQTAKALALLLQLQGN